MDRRHQVFISSTYADLTNERAEVIQALLELDCIPAGMELFPATTEDAWDLIKGVIDDSDYYCLVIGGRYGSLDATGISYTEKEYDYAVSKKKPVLAFVHAKPGEIATDKSEKTDAGRERLDAFKKKVEATHHRKTWSSATELGGLVSRSLVNLRKTHPAEGWVRGRFAATDALLVEVANLRARVAELTAESSRTDAESDPRIVESLASGSDTYSPVISYIEDGKTDRSRIAATIDWDFVLRYVGPALLNECSDSDFEDKLKLCFYHAVEAAAGHKVKYQSIVVPHVTADQIKIQLRALGHMAVGTKRRAVADKQSYWRLTSAGERRLISVQALTKPEAARSPVEALMALAVAKSPESQPALELATPSDGSAQVNVDVAST